jgi:hypothetical protein
MVLWASNHQQHSLSFIFYTIHFFILLIVGDCFAAMPAARTPTTAVGWLRTERRTPRAKKLSVPF